ncbi:hypothetical protein HH214_06305 [Mucilaginibacter robiniae]|uniref:Cytochrome c-552/4 domain-containing protein n=1 Tax=Mucilaginibacter robiniae TaxID=2728022 RepID=A0A7L5DWP8_9SPHI|nr:hypothetical protein [Mucilaginibacter robiniae]QJD95510.1 hypothetical protein HH214_06305 [Mucilaginibacter robiniae]
MIPKRYIRLLIVFLVPLTVIFSQCLRKDQPVDARGELYAGSKACMKCHKDIYSNYLHTAHYQTSRLASAGSIHGSFEPEKNTVVFNAHLKAVMEKRKNGFYQVSYVGGKPTEAHPFNLTIGGIKAETYLYWKDKQVLQLPMSYYVGLKGWGNSPGYEGDHIDFSRVIGIRCFECHASYGKELPQESQSLTDRPVRLDKNALMLSIDCERCHGPGTNHVNYHTEYPDVKTAKYIAKYSALTRAQKIDMCAQCHSGNSGRMVKSTFTFKPGDALDSYKEVSFYHPVVDSANLDVHGNQTQLLASSPCFIKSKMDCATCHNTHNNERGIAQLFVNRCQSCHSTAKHNFCPLANQLSAAVITSKCIDCHMPAKSSSVIAVHNGVQSTAVPYRVRTHRITIYPEETKKVLAWLKAEQAGSSTKNKSTL